MTNQINTKKNKTCQYPNLSKRQIAHRKFIKSPEWLIIRTRLFEIRGKKCEQCGSIKSIQVHHLNYQRFGGQEKFEDLLILCGLCHAAAHKKKPKKKKLSRIDYRVLVGERFDIPKNTSTTWKGMARAIALLNGNFFDKISKPKAMKYVKHMCK